MPDRATTTGTGPETPPPDPSTGLVDPRTIHPGPDDPATTPDEATGREPTEAPDIDPTAWEGPDPGRDAPGLADPRREARGPGGP